MSTPPDSTEKWSKQHEKNLLDKNDKDAYLQESETDLSNNPKYRDFFSRFNSESVKKFVVEYSRKRWALKKESSWIVSRRQSNILQFKFAAEREIWEIQQPKLFILQCLWRAEQIELPGVNCTYDFLYWSDAIRNCSFLDPITEGELESYCNYLLTNDEDYDRWYSCPWQNYNEIKKQLSGEEKGLTIPEWYWHYNSRTSFFSNLQLPDIRGEKEKHYEEWYWQGMKVKQEVAGKMKDAALIDLRPHLSAYYSKELDEFILRFEDGETNEAHLAQKEYSDNSDRHSRLANCISLLQSSDEEIAMESAPTWQEALIRTAHKFSRRKTVEAMPLVYEEYNWHIEMGIPFQEDEDAKNRSREINDFYANNILQGRKLCGEPEDWNF